MTAKELHQLNLDQKIVSDWLKRINETDEAIINETMNAMRTKPEYRKFIVDYAKGHHEHRQ